MPNKEKGHKGATIAARFQSWGTAAGRCGTRKKLATGGVMPMEACNPFHAQRVGRQSGGQLSSFSNPIHWFLQLSSPAAR